jgi:hypothetical protein
MLGDATGGGNATACGVGPERFGVGASIFGCVVGAACDAWGDRRMWWSCPRPCHFGWLAARSSFALAASGHSARIPTRVIPTIRLDALNITHLLVCFRPIISEGFERARDGAKCNLRAAS